jgi:hypothetical protein
MLYKEFQIEPSDSELFASGYFIGNESIKVYFFGWQLSYDFSNTVLNQTPISNLNPISHIDIKNNLFPTSQ